MGRFQNNYGRLHNVDLIMDASDQRSNNDKQYAWEMSSEIGTEDFSDSASIIKPPQTMRARIELEAIDDDDDFQAVCSGGRQVGARQKQIPRNPSAEKSFEVAYAKRMAEEAIQNMIPQIQSSSAASDASASQVRPISTRSEVASSETSDQSDNRSELSSVLKNLTRFPRRFAAPPTTVVKPTVEPAKISDLVPAGFSLNQLDSFGETKMRELSQKIAQKTASSTSSSGTDGNRRHQAKPTNYDTYSVSDEPNCSQPQQNGNVRRNNRHNDNDRHRSDDAGNRKYASNNNNNHQRTAARNQQRGDNGRNESKFKKAIVEEAW